MTSLRVSVTYTVEIVDEQALLQAGADAWLAGAEQPTWTVKTEGDGQVVEATAGEADAARPDAEASVAIVLGHQGYPMVPGVRFTTMSVNATEEAS
ncbi:hypothetical protein A7K94_0201785 [Modestobacter sp. VKM Ac-2676]|nr:hypothetical protein A7K94_0201785 [Modestobacter sp. VKM Ac-2676]